MKLLGILVIAVSLAMGTPLASVAAASHSSAHKTRQVQSRPSKAAAKEHRTSSHQAHLSRKHQTERTLKSRRSSGEDVRSHKRHVQAQHERHFKKSKEDARRLHRRTHVEARPEKGTESRSLRRHKARALRASYVRSRRHQLHAERRQHSLYRRAHLRTRPRHKAPTTYDTWLEHAQEGQLVGKASWYGSDFHGGPTASGLRYDMYTFTAAHRTLPLGTLVKVTRQDSGQSVIVCVTDRGPYVRGRIIDLSYAAADQLGLRKKGVGDVNLEVVSDEKGTPLKRKQAFYVTYSAVKGVEKSGPYKEFADACAMQEAIRQAHPDAAVVLEPTR